MSYCLRFIVHVFYSFLAVMYYLLSLSYTLPAAICQCNHWFYTHIQWVKCRSEFMGVAVNVYIYTERAEGIETNVEL